MPRVATSITLGVVAVLLTALAVVAGTALRSADDVDEPSAPVTAPPLPDLDTATMPVARAGFCAEVAETAVVEALGGDATDAVAYDDGELARITPKVTDIAHEFGCRWDRKGATARAWVFAPPVTPARAEQLIETARAGATCRPIDGAPAFGSPSLALTCRTGKGPQVTFRGLFGDAWLVCSLNRRGDVAPVITAAERWCGAVLVAATPPSR
ncbi:hypothetical protein [Nocardioides sp. R-C-SC26]|uniref:hypothetical protein n=1 Tax=Nocardioides sp. R-C-SC26 TaxID=2870414 RepID=UPI001E2D30DF|nr:hypothetical protein [Nocardioides sp. R-C-SC26]